VHNASPRSRPPEASSRHRWPLVAAVLAELCVLAAAVLAVGPWPVAIWTLATGAAGAVMLTRGGPRDVVALLEFWHASSGGARGLALAREDFGDGVLRAVASLALLMPGLVTDAVGLALLCPPVRRRILQALGRRGPVRVSRRNEVRNRPPTGEWQAPRSQKASKVEVLPPEVAPPTPFDDAAPVVIEVRPVRRREDR
jgi:UPF0716 protein FxsA